MRLILLLFIVPLLLPVYSQVLIEANYLGEKSVAELEFEFGENFRTGIKYYNVTYLTTGSDGLPDTASGLIVVPNQRFANAYSIVAYQHGTTTGPSDVPSTLQSGSDEALGYGGMGYIVSAADYLGLGSSRGFHPYVHRETEASAGIDMLRATREFIEDQTGETDIEYLFVAGYSQGGHGAMAMVQDLELNHSGEFSLTASTPMSGPYDISGVMYQKMISNEAYLFVGYVPYTLLSYQEVYGNIYESLDDVFKSNYVVPIEAFYNGEIDLAELTTYVYIQLVFEAQSPIPKYMFKDTALARIIADENHPLRVAMRDNDTYNWTPQAPMELYYCMADDQVPYRNSLVADSILHANGATDLTTYDLIPDATHVECAPPAILKSAQYFDSFVMPLASTDISTEAGDLAFPNPANDKLNLNIPQAERNWITNLYNIEGRLVKTWVGNEITLDVSGIHEGLYLIQVEMASGSTVQKVYIRG